MNTSAADNQATSFAELPAEEQVKLLVAHNRSLFKQIDQLHERFAGYEESDARLLRENRLLKKQLAERTEKVEVEPKLKYDPRLDAANNEIIRLRHLVDVLGGDPDGRADVKWFAKLVRQYLRHHGIDLDEFNGFVQNAQKSKGGVSVDVLVSQQIHKFKKRYS